MKTAALFLLCVVSLLATGCDVFMPKTTARIVAGPYVKPFLTAIEAYHKSHSQYPERLDELRSENPKLLEGLKSLDNGALFEKVEGDVGEWTVGYKRETPDSYLLTFQRGETDAAYRNGKLVSADSNWTR
jgi:hypothetical protein